METASIENNRKAVRWLFVLCGLVFAIFALAGVTRLNHQATPFLLFAVALSVCRGMRYPDAPNRG